MLALYRSGRQVEALRAYHAGYQALAEIGVRPGHELRALEAASVVKIRRCTPGSDHCRTARPRRGREPGCSESRTETGRARRRTACGRHAVDSVVETAERAGRLVSAWLGAEGRAPYQSVADALAPLLDARRPRSRRWRRSSPAVPPAPGSDPAFQRFQAFESVLECCRPRRSPTAGRGARRHRRCGRVDP